MSADGIDYVQLGHGSSFVSQLSNLRENVHTSQRREGQHIQTQHIMLFLFSGESIVHSWKYLRAPRRVVNTTRHVTTHWEEMRGLCPGGCEKFTL